MRIKMTFQGGEARYGTNAVNFLTPDTCDHDTNAWLASIDDDVACDLYEERAVADDAPETFGYDDMADCMAAKLRAAGVNLLDVEWWYGSNPDGTPAHCEEA